MKTNRRSFIKQVSCLLGGALASISCFVSAALPGQPKWVEDSFRRQDICRPKPAKDELGYWERPENFPTARSGTKFNTKDYGDWNPKDGWSHIVGVEFVDKNKEAVVYIDGKKAKKAKDGSYRI